MTTYNTRVENYGPNGLIDEEVVEFELTGEAEQRYLSPARLRQFYPTIRQWSLDAQAAYDDWPNKTQTQKDVALRETIRRLGVMMDRLADMLLVEA